MNTTFKGWLKRWKLTPALLVALVLLLGALVALLTATFFFIDQDRADMVERFSEARLKQITDAAREVGGDMEEIIKDLHFAGNLIRSSKRFDDRPQILTALLGSVRPYRAAAIYDTQVQKNILTVTDPRNSSKITQTLLNVMARTARRATSKATGRLETSFPVEDSRWAWYRVFATRLQPTGLPSPPIVLALLVDTEPFLEKLRLVASDPQSDLLIIGPHGRHASISDPRLLRTMNQYEANANGLRKFAHVVELMRRGSRGTVTIDRSEAQRIGFEPAELIVAYAPIPIKGSPPWSVGMFATTATLRTLERKMITQMAMVSAGIALSLLIFGSYVLVTSRRALVLRERLLHTKELAHAHEKAEKILENIPTGVMALSESGRIMALNRAMRRRLPYSALGQNLLQAFPQAPPGTLNRIEGLVKNALATNLPQSLLVERLTLFGEEGQYSLHAVPLEHPFPETRVLLVLEDFTEVRALESQLLRSEKLATVGILAAGVAHEIGTPLGVVRGRAEYIRGKLKAESKEADGLRIIIEQIDRVTHIIRELLDFSRIKPATVSPVILDTLVKKVVDLLGYEATRRKVQFVVNVDSNLPPIAADADQLQQVLVNLLMNACAACTEKEKVTVSASYTPMGHPTQWDHIRVEIIDEGCGIPTENLHRVFDPFFTTKKRGQGTGLGLTIVSQIVRNHGAEIELDSKEGHGTKVVLRWPTSTSSTGANHG